MPNTASKIFGDVRIVERVPTWRGHKYILSYLLLDHEPSVDELVACHQWAREEQLQNPRVISPSVMRWSSLFNPRFFRATTMDRSVGGKDCGVLQLAWTNPESELNLLDLTRFWLESVTFLAGVTLSAAIVQSRHSKGTIGSKYDRLWEAGVLADCGIAPELQVLGLLPEVKSLADTTNISDVDRLLRVRGLFMSVLTKLACSRDALATMRAGALTTAQKDRFGFVDSLRQDCGSKLRALIVYGSSISGSSFADYDVLVIVDDPESFLRRFAGTSPTWDGKELNIGVYSPEELVVMQRLSGDNLADYGVCLFGETLAVCKPLGQLIARNFSFGVVRQRQQLGMLSRATEPPLPSDDDRRNLYDYFVKIPANVAKGTFGAMGNRLPKEAVLKWLRDEVKFDAPLEQQRAVSDPVRPLAASALATGAVLETLNERLKLVHPVEFVPVQTEVR
jgi:hypothetical protein